jgi:hypothetical protein
MYVDELQEEQIDREYDGLSSRSINPALSITPPPFQFSRPHLRPSFHVQVVRAEPDYVLLISDCPSC